MQVAPWADEPGADGLPGILRKLRGEWPCVPFGYSVSPEGFAAEWVPSLLPGEPGEEVHGYCSNHDWQWDEAPPGIAEAFPRLSRDKSGQTGDPRDHAGPGSAPPSTSSSGSRSGRTAACRSASIPSSACRPKPGGARLEPGRFDHGLTYPGMVEPSAPLFAENRRFDDLALGAAPQRRNHRRAAPAARTRQRRAPPAQRHRRHAQRSPMKRRAIGSG